MQKELNRFVGVIRKAVDEYKMIDSGDKIAVGVSGGKDSMVLLCALKHLQRFYPTRFELEAITIDLGFETMDFSPVAEFCHRIDLRYTIIKTDIKQVVFDERREDNPCSLCAKMRRGALNDAMKEHGCNKLALGHHYNDAVETFLLSLLYEGRISCFKPVTYMSRADVHQIRPMVYAKEPQIQALAGELNLPIVENPCPQDKGSKRYEIKKLIKTLSGDFSDLENKLFGAMQRLPLEGWEPERRIR